ncbi:hypothetical protein BBP40_002393 [Aspergillus hancockii]|nr:hypothetical protein BBP40_002393 [Aspergillus hancockii]
MAASQETSRQMNNSLAYCIWPEGEKIRSIVISSVVTFLSPVSGTIYFPALGQLSRELHVSQTTIQLTITVYLIAQGFAPLLTGSFSDAHGRRPFLLSCLILAVAANIGLAFQTSVPALFTLRCLQSIGGSTVATVAIAVVADIVTRAERGKYMAYTSLGFTIGPVVGPLLGGILTQFLGWRSVFVFLAILAGIMIILILLFLPETCRAIVGNGSVPPPQWNRSILQLLHPDSFKKEQQPQTVAVSRRRPSFFDSIRIAGQNPTGLLMLAITLISCGSMAIFASIPVLFGAHYHFNALEIGLCYIPYGVGGLAARWTIGIMVDRNFQRHSRELGLDLPRNQQTPQHLRDMPLEKARLQLTLPLVYASSAIIILYGWVMQARVHVSGPLVVLFFLGIVVTGTRNTLFTLIVDLHASRPATATAGVAFFRALSCAGVVAAIVPLLKAIGIGWTVVLIAAVWAVSSSALWVVYLYGHEWRQNGRQHNGSG